MDNGRLETLKNTIAVIQDMGDENKESIPRRVYVKDVGDLVDALESVCKVRDELIEARGSCSCESNLKLYRMQRIADDMEKDLAEFLAVFREAAETSSG